MSLGITQIININIIKNWVPGTFSNNWLRTSDYTLVIWFLRLKIKIICFSILFYFILFCISI